MTTIYDEIKKKKKKASEQLRGANLVDEVGCSLSRSDFSSGVCNVFRRFFRHLTLNSSRTTALYLHSVPGRESFFPPGNVSLGGTRV